MKASAAQELLKTLVELELSRLIFGPFYVLLHFTGALELSVRVNKSFEVLSSNGSLAFDIASSHPQPAAAALVACIQSKVAAIELTAESVRIPFSNGSTLVTTIGGSDFEPLEMSCWHHMSPSKLEWFTTVEAG